MVGVGLPGVARVADAMFAPGAPHGLSLALVVLHRGEVVLERYGTQPDTVFGPGGPVTADTPMVSWSVAKSITHAAVGILVADGLLDLEAPAAVPAWRGTEKAAITLQQLLEMRSGLRFVEDYVDGDTSHCLEMLFGAGASDVASYAASLPLDHEPGTVWNYSSGSTNIVARILGDAVGGGREAMESFLRDRLFAPVGMASAQPRFDDAGTFIGSSYVYSTARDFAAFGELYRNDGIAANGSRVLPEGWVDHARRWSASDPESRFDYGAHWWLWRDHPGVFSANGYEGQHIVVDPEHELVVVHLGKCPAETRDLLEGHLVSVLDGIGDDLPRYGDRDGRENDGSASNGGMTVDSSDSSTGELPRLPLEEIGGPPRPRRIRPARFTLKLFAFVVVIYFGIATIIPGVRRSSAELRNVSPWLLLLGLALEVTALVCYSLLTKATLGDSGHKISVLRLFRIQLSTKALSSVVPGGSAAGSALGYRLMTLSGVSGPDAGFAVATSGLGSAVVLNFIFWAGLLVSIPIRGVNPGYASAAVAGIVLMVIAGALVVGLLEGQHTAERVVRWVARRLKLSEDRASAGVRQIAARLEDLVADRALLLRVAGWAAANWLFDAAALWVFLRAFGASTDIDALIVAFGLVNVLAVIPITPGGLGIIDGGLPLALTGFGLTRATAVLGTATYRLANYFFPILLGGMLYATLRVGPWSIKRRDELKRLRELAGEAAYSGESVLDFAARFGRRRRPTENGGGPRA